VWSFCPNAGAAIAFAVFFFLTTTAHIIQAIYHRKPYCWVLIMGALWQLAAFISRYLSVRDQTSSILYQIWFLLILVAPLWINAFVYMVMGRMVWNFLPEGKMLGIEAHRFGLWFVLMDIL